MSCRSWALTAEGGGDMVGGWMVLCVAPSQGRVEKDAVVQSSIGMKKAR